MYIHKNSTTAVFCFSINIFSIWPKKSFYFELIEKPWSKFYKGGDKKEGGIAAPSCTEFKKVVVLKKHIIFN
jgi:hypothetical protein